jgi:molecular chaperone GrpE
MSQQETQSQDIPKEPATESSPDATGASSDALALALAERDAAIAERDAARAEAAEHRDQFLRAMADFDTFRRRAAKDRDEARQLAAGKLLEDFVPVYDALSIALQSLQNVNEPSAVAKGIEMVQSQFRSALEKNGISEINPAAGDEFDPNRHESVTAQSHELIGEGRVVSVFRTGFSIGTRVLRPASVVLSSGPGSKAD